MQQTNREIVQSFYDAGRRGDLEAMISFLDPEVTIMEAESLPYGGTYHGPEGFRRLIASVHESFRGFEIEVESILEGGEGGEQVVALLQLKLGLKGSDREVTMPVAELWKLRDGKVIELRPFYWDTAALSASARP